MIDQGKRIVITGAGSGLGRATALEFARAGWAVASTDIDADRARDTLRHVEQLGSEGFSAVCDVADTASVRALVDQVEERWQGLDVLVNNAGVAAAGTVADTPLVNWDWMLNVNLMGVVRGCHLFAPLFIRQGSGHVINIASFAGIAAAPGMAAYNAAKAGVISLSESLRAEMAPLGIEVSVVCPAFFASNLGDSLRSTDPRIKPVMDNLMQRSTVSADHVARDIHRAVTNPRFLVLTHREARWGHRFKRLSPEWFFRSLMKMAHRVLPQSHENRPSVERQSGVNDR